MRSCSTSTALAVAPAQSSLMRRHAGHPPPPNKEEFAKYIPLLAAYGASTFNRTASRRGFEQKGRAMLTGDLVDLVGPVFVELFGKYQDVQLEEDEDRDDEAAEAGGKGRL